MYMPGRRRTASSPSRTVMSLASEPNSDNRNPLEIEENQLHVVYQSAPLEPPPKRSQGRYESRARPAAIARSAARRRSGSLMSAASSRARARWPSLGSIAGAGGSADTTVSGASTSPTSNRNRAGGGSNSDSRRERICRSSSVSSLAQPE